jgi:hypothetical protein
MLYMKASKGTFLCFFLIMLSLCKLKGQDDTLSFDTDRKIFVGIDVSLVKDLGKQAYFFNGANPVFGLYELLNLPTIKSELLTKTGKNFTLASYPDLMRYNGSLGIGLNLMYCSDDINFILNGSYSKLVTAGFYTLSTEDPANPFGEPIIITESISGTERRTWLKTGVQFKNEVNQRNDFFVELAPIVFFQKALKNEVEIEGSRYSILINNPGNVAVQSSFVGYGLNLGLGMQTWFLKNKMTQVGVNFNASKLKMLVTNKLNYLCEFYLSVFL